MIMHDDEHNPGFSNSDERDMINTTHAYIEKVNMQTKFRLWLILEELNSTPCHHLTGVQLKLTIVL